MSNDDTDRDDKHKPDKDARSVALEKEDKKKGSVKSASACLDCRNSSARY
jgi:hypothetical protein